MSDVHPVLNFDFAVVEGVDFVVLVADFVKVHYFAVAVAVLEVAEFGAAVSDEPDSAVEYLVDNSVEDAVAVAEFDVDRVVVEVVDAVDGPHSAWLLRVGSKLSTKCSGHFSNVNQKR